MPLLPFDVRLHRVMERHADRVDQIFLFDVQRDVEIVLTEHLEQLLKSFPSKVCSCGATIWMVPNAAGFATPFDQHANNHFMNCPDRENYKKGKS